MRMCFCGDSPPGEQRLIVKGNRLMAGCILLAVQACLLGQGPAKPPRDRAGGAVAGRESSGTAQVPKPPYEIRSRRLSLAAPGKTSIVLPEFVVPAHPEMARKLNAGLEQLARRDVQAYTEDFRHHPSDELKQHFELTWSFEVKFSGRRFVSVLQSRYAFTGGAHGLGTTQSIVVDTERGAVVELEQLFRPGSAYLERLSRRARPRLEKLVWDKGIAPEAENFATWLITKQGLFLYFQVYQIAPYVSGPSLVTIPWSELQDLLVLPVPEVVR